jgi:hypothetical protein
VEFARADFIDAVDRRVVIIEIPLRVGGEAGNGDALKQQRADIGTGGTFGEGVDAIGLEESAPLFRGALVGVALRAAEIETARLKAAAVGFDGEDVLLGFLFDRARVGGRAAEAVFFVGEEHAAQRVAGF